MRVGIFATLLGANFSVIHSACPTGDCGCSWATSDTCGSNPGLQDTCWQVCCCEALGEENYQNTLPSPVTNPTPNPGSNPTPNPVNQGDWEGVAKTTRYWDCCKPSCSWPGKVEIAEGFTPVKGCLAGGGYANANTKSGCGGGGGTEAGGPSFACPDQQPWTADDGVLYAFAAGGGGDAECCTCYELEFLDYSIGASSYQGQLEGKKMVVQVTNTGSDLGQKHFDIQIPGGGFGIFNACVGPENDIPFYQTGSESDWGQRYGGVNSDTQCANIPQNVQDGCNWRFNDFLNSDNPAVKYRAVRCPDSLVAKSGCRLANEVSREAGGDGGNVDQPTPTPTEADEPCYASAQNQMKVQGKKLWKKNTDGICACGAECELDGGVGFMYKGKTLDKGKCFCFRKIKKTKSGGKTFWAVESFE